MIRYWILAGMAASLGSCNDMSGIFGDSIQPEGESAFAQAAAKPKLNAIDPTPRAGETQMFYNLSDDPENPHLLALDSIAGSKANRSVLMIDLFGGDERFGLMTTWRIDCMRSETTTIRAMMFRKGESGPDRPIKTEVISTQSSPETSRMAELVCDGKGHLEKDRVYRGTVTEIVSRFWAGELVANPETTDT